MSLPAEALLLGISSGPACLASCGPVLLPALAAERKPPGGTAVVLVEFLAGRLAGYLAFAVIAWLAGFSLASRPEARMLVLGVANIGLAVLLAAYAFALPRTSAAPCGRTCARYRHLAPAAIGLITGVSPTLLTAFVLEYVNRTITVVFQFVPMWLGVDEAGTGLMTAAIGLTGATGVALVREVRPQVVLLDVGLPDLDGYEVCRQIRGELGRAARIIAVTGWGQAADKQRAAEAGFDAHVTKPADPGTLRRYLTVWP